MGSFATTLVATALGSLGPAATPAPTEAQVGLYTQANAAFDAGDYETAVGLLDQAIALAPLNVLHLSKARSLQKLGRCVEARDQLSLASSAPAVAQPDEEAVAERIERYTAELASTCPGRLEVRCVDATTRVAVAAETPVSCEAFARDVSPGDVELVASVGDETRTFHAQVRAFETTVVEVTLQPSPPPPAEAPVPDAGPNDRRRNLRLSGQILVGTGAATLLAALLVDTVLGPRRIQAFDDARETGQADALELQRSARRAQIGSLVAYSVGAAALVTGAVLWGVSAKGRNRRAAVGPSGVTLRF